MAAKPAILAVDDDAPVLRAVERDLRARYGDDYRVIGAGSGGEALEVVRELTQRGDAVALLLVDQRMPVVTGVEFLAEAIPLQPDAKRVLLTAYADTDVAIRAINEIRLDQYLLKPWDPPEERLYPVVDDLLADWIASFRPPFEGVRLLSSRWAPRGHDIAAGGQLLRGFQRLLAGVGGDDPILPGVATAQVTLDAAQHRRIVVDGKDRWFGHALILRWGRFDTELGGAVRRGAAGLSAFSWVQ